MALSEVIGIEIGRSSLAERAQQEGTQKGLVLAKAQPSTFRLTRRFDKAYVEFREVQVRTAKAGYISAMTIVPNGQKLPPAAFVLDEECRYLKFPGTIPDEMDTDDFNGPFYGTLPLGSHLIGSGFAVAFPTPRTLRKKEGTVFLADWIALVKRFETEAGIDPGSLFLVATEEHTELALRLAANMTFAGVVIEGPRQMLFAESARKRVEEESKKEKKKPDESTAADAEAPSLGYFESMTHVQFYIHYTRSVKEPMLIILPKNAPEFDQIQKTLLAFLVRAEAPFSAVLIDTWARQRLSQEAMSAAQNQWIGDSDDELQTREKRAHSRLGFRYDEAQFEKWINRMTAFMIEHSKTQPMYLPPPEPNDWRSGGAANQLFEGLGSAIEMETGEGESENAGGE